MWAGNHKYSSSHGIYSSSATIVVFLLTAGWYGFPSVLTFIFRNTEKPKDHLVKVGVLMTCLV